MNSQNNNEFLKQTSDGMSKILILENSNEENDESQT